jgi:hypothetical protein
MSNDNTTSRKKRIKNTEENSPSKPESDSGCESGSSPTSSLSQELIKLTIMDCVQKMGKPEISTKVFPLKQKNIKISVSV